MYKESDLARYDYFSNVLTKTKLEFLLDSLTGLVNRKYMLEFIKELISENKPFNMGIVDLDKFKDINDKYGHATGDYILEHVAIDLINYVGEKGIVGRFGGDEFIIILFNMDTYELVHPFYTDMIHGNVFRKTHHVTRDIEITVTSTIGSARFPYDAKTFDELFLMSDKTLYRGKTKGRNCFIIYVHEKHKDLQILKMRNDDLPTMMFNINSIFNYNDEFKNKLKYAASYLRNNLNLRSILFIDKNNNLYDMETLEKLSSNANLASLRFKNGLLTTNYKDDVLRLPFGSDIKDLALASLVITNLKSHDKVYGYVIFALDRVCKIWETNEISTLMFLGKAIELEYLVSHEK